MQPWPYPLWIAHRGAGKLAPENTLAAFRLGASYGYRAFECDVKLSADDVPFLLHDATLERTTGEPGLAGERCMDRTVAPRRGQLAQPRLRRRTAAQPASRGRLRAAQRLCAGPGDQAHSGNRRAHRLPWWRPRWRGSGKARRQRHCSVHSARTPCARARGRAPHLRRALLLDKLSPGDIESAVQLECAALITDHELMDASLLARIHSGRHARHGLHRQRAGSCAASCCPAASTASSPTRSTASRPHSARSATERRPVGGRLHAGLGTQRRLGVFRLRQLPQVADQRLAPAADGQQQAQRRPRKPAPRAGRRARPASRRAAPRGRPATASASASCWSCDRAAAPVSPPGASARKLMNTSTAPRPKSSSINANASTPQRPAGSSASSSQPPPHNTKPHSKLGPGPTRRVKRSPNTLASTVPTPMAT